MKFIKVKEDRYLIDGSNGVIVSTREMNALINKDKKEVDKNDDAVEETRKSIKGHKKSK